MKRRIVFYIFSIITIMLNSCATFKNTKDLYIENDVEKIGKVSLSIPAWSWTNFSKDGNGIFNNKLYNKLYKKAVNNYGEKIDLINVVIKDSVGTNIGIHLGAMIGGTALAYLLNTPEQFNSENNDDVNVSYGLIYLLTLGKIVNISADVIKKEDFNLEDGIFINIDEYKTYSKKKYLTDNLENTKKNELYFSDKQKTKKGIIEEYDEFKKVTFIKNLEIDNKIPLDMYIGKDEENKWLRIRFRYKGSDWIFFDTITIINSNGSSISWKINSWDKNEEILDYGNVYESIDISLSDSKKEELKSLLKGNQIKIRLSGKKYNDYNIDDEYALALLEIITTYDSL